MRSILRNNRRMFWEILNRIIGRKNRIIGTGLFLTLSRARAINDINTAGQALIVRVIKMANTRDIPYQSCSYVSLIVNETIVMLQDAQCIRS